MQHAKMYQSGGLANIGEVAFAVVVEQRFRLGPIQRWVSGTDGDLVEAVVIEITDLRGHAAIPTGDARLFGYIAKCSVAVIAEQQLTLHTGDGGPADLRLDHIFDCQVSP